MIDKIENWETVKAAGDYKRLKAGGYICQVKGVEKKNSKNGNEMLVINFDITQGEFKDYYLERYKNAPRTNGNEPNWQGKYYIVINIERI